MGSINGFDFLFERCKEQKGTKTKKVAVVCPYEDDTLMAIDDASKAGYVSGVLVGEVSKMKLMADKIGVSLDNFEIIEAEGEEKAAEAAVRAVSSGSADLLMKGLIKTATLLKAVLNKEWGLRHPGGSSLLSHVMLAELPLSDKRVIAVTDGGMNMYPDLKTKIGIIKNAVECFHKLGVSAPKIALIGVAERAYAYKTGENEEKISQAASDAAIICKMNERGEISGCVIDGPMGLDEAMSKEMALRAGISSAVAGDADIIVVPDIESGNLLGKSTAYIGNATCAGVLLGAAKPVIMLSRHDTARTKLCSIALGAVVSS